jgi:erythronate-4-phosphate dehydrogenase
VVALSSASGMKVIIDDKIPYIKGALEPYAEVVYLPGSKTTPEVVKDADAIITRTRTKCNEHLLAGSSVKFIATATIGYDHIDTSYCEKAGIVWTNAPGCNSSYVEQYIASALMVLAEKKNFKLSEKTIGIVGVGNVGSKVARIAEIFGMKVLLNDPPRARKEGPEAFVSLDEILQKADIITLHVPLNAEGEDKTFHLANEKFFAGMKNKPIFINSCRGEVMETAALKQALKSGQVSGAVIDCWENEPNIDLELLDLIDLGTPHIAGYSKDGKANGTSMSIQALSRFFKLGIDDWKCSNVELPSSTEIQLNGTNKDEQNILSEAVLSTYDILEDDQRLRDSVETFEKQRGDYPTRREFPTYKIVAKNINKETIEKLMDLGFNVNS